MPIADSDIFGRYSRYTDSQYNIGAALVQIQKATLQLYGRNLISLMDAIQYTLPAVRKSLLISDKVERDESSYNKGALYCTQNFIFHSLVHSSRVIRDTCTMYVHVQCMPIRVQGSQIHGSRVVPSPQVPGSPGHRSQVLGSTEYCVPTVSRLLLNSTAHTIYGLCVWVGG